MAEAKGESYKVVCCCKEGGVRFEIQGVPAFQVFCHCIYCRKWNQTYPVGFAIFPEEAFKSLEGREHIAIFNMANPQLDRSFCKDCGYRLYSQHKEFAFRSVLASSLEGFTFEPQAHVYCKDASPEDLSRFKDDGLPKFSDQPPIAGGSGKQVQL